MNIKKLLLLSIAAISVVITSGYVFYNNFLNSNKHIQEKPSPTVMEKQEGEGVSVGSSEDTALQDRVSSLETQITEIKGTADGIIITTLDAQGSNLLRNSSFEAANGGAPRQWNYQLDSTTGNTYQSQESIRSGSYGLKFQGGGTGNFGISQPVTKTVPGRTYTLSLYVKPVNTSPFQLHFGFWDEQNNKLGKTKDISLSGTHEWQRVSVTISTPGLITDSKNYFPLIEVNGLTKGNFYIDDVQLEESSALTTYNSANAYTGTLAGGSGSGLVITSNAGDLYPADSNQGSLGTSGNKWSSLYLSNATIDTNGNLSLGGGLTVSSAGNTSIIGPIQDLGGQVYNVKAYGAVGNGTTDDTTAVQSAITAATDSNGGIIYFPSGTYLISSQLTIPNYTDAHLRQKTLRFMGTGPANNFCCVAVGGSILDLRASTGVAKIDTRASGYLEIDHLTLKDGGSDTVPFIQTTNTVIHIHDVRFNGTAAGTSAAQDAIILGGTSTTIDGGPDAPFQGYGTVIENNEFQSIRRGVYLRTYANGVVIRDNAWAGNTGTNLSDGAAIELDGTPDNDHGNVIANNTIEVTNYKYGIKLAVASNNNIDGNGFYDPTAGFLGFYRFESTATQNMIIDGVHSTSYPTVSDASNNTNTLITSNTGISTHFAGNVNIGTTTQDIKLNVSDFLTVDTINSTLGIGTSSATLKTQIQAGQLLLNNAPDDPSYKMTLRKNSQNVAWSSLSTLPSIILNGSATDRPEISWYRGLSFWPEFSIRENTTSNTGATFYTGTGSVAPTATMILNSGSVGIGTTSPTSELYVTRALSAGVTGKSLAIFDQIENQDILTASFGGTTKFTISNTGAITDALYTNAGGILYTATTGIIGQSATGTSSQCLLGGAIPAFGSCAAGGTDSPFQVLSGAIVPLNSTLDFLIGGQSTTSAKFAFTNVNSGSPTATISGNLSLVAPTGNSPANTLNILNGGSFTIKTSTLGQGDAGLTTRLILGANGVFNFSNNNVDNANEVTINDPGFTEAFIFSSTASTWNIDVSDLNLGNTDGNLNLYGVAGSGANNSIAFWRPTMWVADTGSMATASASTTGLNFTTSLNGNISFNPGGTGGIGIGTTTPAFKLDLRNSQSATAAAQIFNTNTGTDADGLIIKLGNTSATVVNTTNHFVSFETAGIGIVGSIQGNGGANVAYATNGIADLAEYFKKDPNQSIEWGSVVCQNRSGNVESCSGNSSSIVGVASEFPTFVGGKDLGNGSITVGLSGVVSTEVSNQNGNIKSGDYIALSNNPGVGVKAIRAGQVVGVALQDYESSLVGIIQVRVNPSWYDPGFTVTPDGNILGAQMSQIQPVVSPVLQSQAMTDAYLQSTNIQFNTLTSQQSQNEKSIKDMQGQFVSLSDTVTGLQKQLLQATNSALLGSTIVDPQELSKELQSTSLSIDKNAVIGGTLFVLGRTTLNDLGVTGNITSGLLTINGLEGSINSLGEPLKLQSLGASGIDILSGKVTIDTDGNIKTLGAIDAKKYNVDTSDGQSTSLGEAVLPEGTTSLEIKSTAVTDNSQIFVTSKTKIIVPLSVTSQTKGKSFTVEIDHSLDKDIKFSWWIVN